MTTEIINKPVAAQARFTGTNKLGKTDEWGWCSIEHHHYVQSNSEQFNGYETRLLFAEQPTTSLQSQAVLGLVHSLDAIGDMVSSLMELDAWLKLQNFAGLSPKQSSALEKGEAILSKWTSPREQPT